MNDHRPPDGHRDGEFQIGDAVQPSLKYLDQFPQSQIRRVRGEVVRCGYRPLYRVQWDGLKHPETLHASFIEPFKERVSAPPDGHRDGETYEPQFDYERLNRQQRAVYDVMKDGKWRSLRRISDITGNPEASISARLRDFRKVRFGGFNVDRRRCKDGLHRYRLVLPDPSPQQEMEV